MAEDRQIQSMIAFIEREAQEKVDEIDCAAQEEYDVEKMRLVEAEKGKIRTATERRKKQVEVERRVARANHTKTQRQRVMEDRAQILEQLEASIKQKVMAVVGDAVKYQQLLVDLMRQGLASLQADAIVTCRKCDEPIVKKALKDVETWYQAKSGKSLSVQVAKEYLDDAAAWGGVVMKTRDGRIHCDNTLSYRATQCFKAQLPSIRYSLFNADVPI